MGVLGVLANNVETSITVARRNHRSIASRYVVGLPLRLAVINFYSCPTIQRYV